MKPPSKRFKEPVSAKSEPVEGYLDPQIILLLLLIVIINKVAGTNCFSSLTRKNI